MEAKAAVKELKKVAEKLEELRTEIGSRGGAVNRRRSRALTHLKNRIDREARVTERLKLIEDEKSRLGKLWSVMRGPLIVFAFLGILIWLVLNYGHKLAQLKL